MKKADTVEGRRNTFAALTREPVLNDRVKFLIFEIADDDPRMLPVLHILNHFVRCEEMFRWCLKNKLRGSRLFILLKEQFKGSPLELGKFLLSQIENEEKKRIFEGKDWR